MDFEKVHPLVTDRSPVPNLEYVLKNFHDKLQKTAVAHISPYATNILKEDKELINNCEFMKIPKCIHQVHDIYCRYCSSLICFQCFRGEHLEHDGFSSNQAKNEIESLTTNTLHQTMRLLKHLKMVEDKNYSMMNHLEIHMNSVGTGICQTMRQLEDAIKCRDSALKKLLTNIYQSKKTLLNKQLTSVENLISAISNIKSSLTAKINSDNPIELIKLHMQAKIQIQNIKSKSSDLQPCEDAKIFYETDANVPEAKIKEFSSVVSNARAENTVASGIGTEKAVLMQVNYFTIQGYDYFNKKVKTGGEEVKATLEDPTGNIVHIIIHDYLNGEYSGIYYTLKEGTYILRISLRSSPIKNWMHTVMCSPRRSIQLGRVSNSVTMNFNFMKAWGIHCDVDGCLYVTDIEAHRFMIFDYKLNLLDTFGCYGDKAGELKFPAGITVDNQRRIIIADKDNHRIQLFSTNGEFLFKFGRRGEDSGEFCFPWDVDTNSQGHIVVSDSKNERIQIFDKNGVKLYSVKVQCPKIDKFLEIDRPHRIIVPFRRHVNEYYYGPHPHQHTSLSYKYQGPNNFNPRLRNNLHYNSYNPYKNQSVKKIIATGVRGVKFFPNGKILVADFLNSAAQIFSYDRASKNFKSEKVLDRNTFGKVQGVYVNSAGNVFVPDQTRNKIYIYKDEYFDELIHEIKTDGRKFEPFNLTMSPDGYFYVLDDQSNIHKI